MGSSEQVGPTNVPWPAGPSSEEWWLWALHQDPEGPEPRGASAPRPRGTRAHRGAAAELNFHGHHGCWGRDQSAFATRPRLPWCAKCVPAVGTAPSLHVPP